MIKPISFLLNYILRIIMKHKLKSLIGTTKYKKNSSITFPLIFFVTRLVYKVSD